MKECINKLSCKLCEKTPEYINMKPFCFVFSILKPYREV